MRPCPTCGDAGPWATTADRTAHIRSHHEEECPDCGKRVNAVSMASHRRILHPATPAEQMADLEVPQPEALPADDLVCPECGKGPFADRRGIGVHRASHERVECPDCGQQVARTGIGAHRRAHQADVTCPHCGGSYKAAGLARHRSRCAAAPPGAPPVPTAAAHADEVYVRCADCDQAVHRDSLDRHRARVHRTAPRRRAQPIRQTRPADPRAVAGALSELLPSAAPDLIARVTALVEKHAPDRDRGLFVVAVPGGAGPWVCPPANVGLVIAREHAAAVVVAVDDIYAYLGHHQADDQSPFHAGASWPHPKATR